MTIYKYAVEKLYIPIDVYTHYVMTWVSIDGGANYYHCGMTVYFKSEKEAHEYIEMIKHL